MIPIKSDAVPYRFSFVTYGLIAICLVIVPFQNSLMNRFGAFIPLDFIHSLFHPSSTTIDLFISLFLSFFFHGGLKHLISNMLCLLVFGNAVEYETGHIKFLLIYICCGVLSMLIQAASNPISSIPIVGASGAIAGIMGMYLVLHPFSGLYLWPLFIFRIPAFIFLLSWLAMQYLSIKYDSAGNGVLVAWWAHIGGFLSGVVFAIKHKMKNTRKKKRRRKK